MKTLKNIAFAGIVLLGSLAYNAKAQEFYRMHFQGFNQEIAEELDDPSCPERANLVVKVQEGYKLEEFEQREVRGFFQQKAGSYIADRLIESLKKSGLRKYIEPIEKIAKGVEVSVPRTKEKIKIKPEIELDSEANLQGELGVTYKNIGMSARTDREVSARVNFFKEDNKRLSIEAGYNDSLSLGLRFGIIY